MHVCVCEHVHARVVCVGSGTSAAVLCMRKALLRLTVST